MTTDSLLFLIDRCYIVFPVTYILTDLELNPTYVKAFTDSSFFPDILLREILSAHILSSRKQPFIYSFSPCCHMSVFNLKEQILFIGPILTDIMPEENRIEVFSHRLSENDFQLVDKIIANTRVTTILNFSAMLSLVIEGTTGLSISYEEIITNNHFSEDLANIVNYSLDNISEDIFDRYSAFLIQITAAISSGSKHTILNLQKNLPSFNFVYNMHTQSYNYYVIIPFLSGMMHSAILGGAIPSKVFKQYQKCIKEYQHLSASEEMNMMIYKWAIDFANLVTEKVSSIQKPLSCYKCEEYIENHLSEQITVPTLAQISDLSVRQINRLFKKYYSMSPIEYITKRRMHKASIMLVSTDLSISEISESVGYISQSYFIQKFTQTYNCTPGNFRKDPTTRKSVL